MATSKIFRPDDAGARQRLLHWINATAALLSFVVAGTPGLMVYFAGLLLLHGRMDRVRGFNLMERLLEWRRQTLAQEWGAFLHAQHRRAMSLAGPRPHRYLAAACVVTLMVLTGDLGERTGVGDASTLVAAASRFGMALAVSALMWGALFGLRRRTSLVFGMDGVRVSETFVPYATVTGFTRKPNGVLIERKNSLPSIFVPMADLETTEYLIRHLHTERDRALRWRVEPSRPLPAAGFRESASQEGWRIRLLDATSAEERGAVLARVSTEELREVLDQTADPSLEDALQARMRREP